MCVKADVLDAGGYVFDYRYGTYVNVWKKTLFSLPFIEAHDADELTRRIASVEPTEEWRFFCMTPTAPSVREKLIKAYNAYARQKKR